MSTRYTRFGSAYAALSAKNLSELFLMPVTATLNMPPAAGSVPFAPGPRLESVVTLAPLRDKAVLSLDCDLAFSWIDRLSGGTGTGPFTARPLTDIEVALLEYPLITFLNALHFANAAGEDIKPRLLDGPTYVDYGKDEAADATLSYVRLSVESGGLEGSVILGLPEKALAVFTGAADFVPEAVSANPSPDDGHASVLRELESLSGRIGALENRLEECLSKPESSRVASPKSDSSVGQTIEKFREADSLLLAGEIVRRLKSDDPDALSHAAVLIAALGSEKSAEIFKHLSHEDLLTLTFQVARLESFDDDDVSSVLLDYSGLLESRSRYIDGIDFMRETLERAIGAQAAVDAINELTDSLAVRPFDFIRSTDPGRLIPLLAGESSQFTAMLLSFMEPRFAAIVLDALPEDVQVSVTKKILTMGHTLPAVVRNVEKVLEAKLGESKYGDCLASGGPEAVVEILNLASRETEVSIMARLDAESPEAAELIRKKMFVFEDIVLLGDKAARSTFLECDPADLVLASRTLPESVRSFIQGHLSDEAARTYESGLESGNTAEPAEVEAAQRRIVDVVRKLEEAGAITTGE